MLKLAVFQVDCTPPVGTPVLYGSRSFAQTESVRDPLYLRGFIFDYLGERCLVATMDYCGLMNRAHDQMTAALAAATDTDPEKTVVHCVHQHDAPLINFEIEPLLGYPTFCRDWWQGVVKKCADSARTALSDFQAVTHIGHNEFRVHGFASNRRIEDADGTVVGTRLSRCQDPELKNQPVGLIDPMLRTVAFRSGSKLIASMSFYATHPQVSNGRKMTSADAPGEAIRRVSEAFPGALHGYFTGASGNVTAGKYTSTTDLESNLLHFGGVLADAMTHNLQSLAWQGELSMGFAAAGFTFPFPEIDREAYLRAMNDAEVTELEKEKRAVLMSSYDYRGSEPYRVRKLSLGDCHLFFLPGEPFVEYQLDLQNRSADSFIAVASNCAHDYNYLPLAKHLHAGGYELSLSLCDPSFERLLKNALLELRPVCRSLA